ncbi:MAG: TRAP transporter small permease subunit [Streptosporangiales bacterium]|nr:TRAP transporter small permease subunit [Streptosporangiales bacterium]
MTTMRRTPQFESEPPGGEPEASELEGADLRHLRWRWLDPLEALLLGVCGLLLATFTTAVLVDVLTRALGTPVNWLQELILGAFVWGVFLGGAVAVRRQQHFRLSALGGSLSGTPRKLVETLRHGVVLGVALWLVLSGYGTFLDGFGNFLQPSGTPLAVLTAAIPVCGLLAAVFTIETLVNGWVRGFETRARPTDEPTGEPTGEGVTAGE